MIWDDLKRLLSGPTLFRLDTVLAPRLVPILYLTGMAGLLLWSISHVVWRFSTGFFDGIWGVLEIAVFGLLGLIALRTVCEMLLVFFKTHERSTEIVRETRVSRTLMEDVEEAIHDLAGDDEDDHITPATDPAPLMGDASAPRRPSRSARRTPRNEF